MAYLAVGLYRMQEGGIPVLVCRGWREGGILPWVAEDKRGWKEGGERVAYPPGLQRVREGGILAPQGQRGATSVAHLAVGS